VAERLRIELGDWESMRARAVPVRYTVFVEEQKVPAEIELDEFDASSLHALAFGADGRVLGTGRLLPDGHIGRMAVLRQARGAGVGSALLDFVERKARTEGVRKLVIDSSMTAVSFYERKGYRSTGQQVDKSFGRTVTMEKDLIAL